MPKPTFVKLTSATLAISLCITPVGHAQSAADLGGSAADAGVALYEGFVGLPGTELLIQPGVAMTPKEVFQLGAEYFGQVAAVQGLTMEAAGNLLPQGVQDFLKATNNVERVLVSNVSHLITASEVINADPGERKQMLVKILTDQYTSSLSTAVGTSVAVSLGLAGAGTGAIILLAGAAGIAVFVGANLYFMALGDIQDWQATELKHDLGIIRKGGELCHVTATTKLPREFMCAMKFNRPDDPRSVAFSMCNDIEKVCHIIDSGPDPIVFEMNERQKAVMDNGGIAPKSFSPSHENVVSVLDGTEVGATIETLSREVFERVDREVGFERAIEATAVYAGNGYAAHAFAIQELMASLVLIYMLDALHKKMTEDPDFKEQLTDMMINNPDETGLTRIQDDRHRQAQEDFENIEDAFRDETKALLSDLRARHKSEIDAHLDEISAEFDPKEKYLEQERDRSIEDLKPLEEDEITGLSGTDARAVRGKYREMREEITKKYRSEIRELVNERRQRERNETRALSALHRDTINTLSDSRNAQLNDMRDKRQEERAGEREADIRELLEE